MSFLIGITPQPATILSGTALSAAVPLGALTLVGISMPAAWTAAGLSFQVSPDGGTTFQELVDDAGAAIAFTVAAATFIIPKAFPPYLWRGINLIKVRSGTSGAPVNQGADRVINIITRPQQF